MAGNLTQLLTFGKQYINMKVSFPAPANVVSFICLPELVGRENNRQS
jgi:hypothetical protein